MISPKAFQAIENFDIQQLSELTEVELRPILPCLVRMSLCSPMDVSTTWTKAKKYILKSFLGFEAANNIVGLLSIDFQALDVDARREQQLRSVNVLFKRYLIAFDLHSSGVIPSLIQNEGKQSK